MPVLRPIPRRRAGAPASRMSMPRQPERAERRDFDLVREAASYCADAIGSGALAAMEERAGEYVSEKTWDKTRRSWGTRNCRALAGLARGILDGKKQIHRGVGKVTGFVMGGFGSPRIARLLAEEIAARVPLPFIDDSATIAARGVQATGIMMCLLQGRELVDCACFADVVIAEGKERTKRLLVRAMSDWSGFRYLRPDAALGS